MDIRRQFQGEYLVGVVRRGEEVFVPDGNFEIREGDMISITASPIEMQKLLKKLSALQKSAKSIMIVGASKTAFYLAKMLTDAGNSVKIIEQDKQRCEMFSNGLPGAVVINGDGASQELLLEEGIDKVDAFVALTGMDEENILLSYFAQAKNVPTVIPKVNRNEFVSMAQSFGLYSMVSSKKSVLDVISRYVRALENSQGSNVENLYKLMDGKAEALEFKVGSDFEHVAIPLKRLDLKSNIRIVGIIRGRKTILPTGDDEILAGDKVIVLAAGHRIGKLSDIIA
jgi:trk system potassium uptake protein TrkA